MPPAQARSPDPVIKDKTLQSPSTVGCKVGKNPANARKNSGKCEGKIRVAHPDPALQAVRRLRVSARTGVARPTPVPPRRSCETDLGGTLTILFSTAACSESRPAPGGPSRGPNRTRFSHGRRFFDSRNVQKRATKSDTSGHCLLCTAANMQHMCAACTAAADAAGSEPLPGPRKWPEGPPGRVLNPTPS